jgi:GntR family transcriptional regulator, rspAB operon transcriptional repressor
MPPETLKLRTPSRARLVDDVYRSLEEAILSGRMQPGERIVEAWLSEHLEVSRTTVREALLMLEREGYVVSEPRRGTFVTRLTREEALDLCYNRALLESFAVRAGYTRIDDQLVTRMSAVLDQMRQCRLPDDVPQLLRCDLAFHRCLIELAGSRRLLDMWSSLNGQIGALFLRGLEHQNASIDDVVMFHLKMLDAIRSGDPQLAQQTIIEHYVREDERNALHIALIQQLTGTLGAAYQADFHPQGLGTGD